MSAKTVLAIDQSTSGTKALLFDERGELLDRHDLPHEQKINSQGWVSHDPLEIYKNTIQAAAQLLEETGVDRKFIGALGISNQRETALVWDRDTGLPVADAVVWQCARAAGICARLEDRAAAIQERTGLTCPPTSQRLSGLGWCTNSSAGRSLPRITPTPPAPSCSTSTPSPGTRRSAAGLGWTQLCCPRCRPPTRESPRQPLTPSTPSWRSTVLPASWRKRPT